jgi:hypothetical protein
MALTKFKGDESDDENIRHMSSMMGPGQVDRMFRQAMQFAWMALPKTRRNVDELEKQVRRIMDRAIEDLRNDAKEFLGDE